MKKAFAFVLLIYTCIGYSQQAVVDSLKTIIDNYGVRDSTYVNIKSNYIGKMLQVAPNDSTLIEGSFDILQISKDISYKKGQVLAYQKLGVLNQYILSNPYKAIDFFQKSMRIINEEPSLKPYGIVSLGNIGTIYYEQQEFRKAIAKYKQMLISYDTHKINAFTNIGNCYGGLKLNDSAIFYYEKAKIEARTTKNTLHLSNILSNLAAVESKAGFTKKSLEHINESLHLINTHQLEMIRAPAYSNAAMVFLKNKDYAQAETYAKDGLKLNKSLRNIYTDKNAWETLALIYDEKKEYKNALKAYKESTKLNDSITSLDRKLEVSRKEIQFAADKEQALAEAEIERQKLIKNITIIGGIVTILSLILGFIAFRYRQKEQLKTKEAEFKTKVADTELKALRAQMNPHFIFNSLNSIGDYIIKNDTKAANDYLTKFAKLMRLTLENSEKKEVLLDDDISLLKTYLDIENKRFENRFTYTIHVDASIDSQNTLVPPLILQPFIENSIKHGFIDKKSSGSISIEFKEHNDMIICAVEDNGIGRNTENIKENSKRQSFGTKLTKTRIDIINQRKKSNGALKIIDKDQGTRVEVSLPLELAF